MLFLKVRYAGSSFGVDSLTNGKIYTVLGVEFGNLRIVDDSGEDYLYGAINPAPMEGDSPGGRWEIVEDDSAGTLASTIQSFSKSETSWCHTCTRFSW